MKPARKAEFDQWYAEQLNRPYDIRKEIEAYVRNDVLVLRECCKIQRSACKTEHGLDIYDSITSPAATLLAFRANYLKDGEIAVMPNHGYGSKHNQSGAALEWLAHVESRKKITLHTVRSATGEATIGGLSVDGWHPGTGTVYQFHG